VLRFESIKRGIDLVGVFGLDDSVVAGGVSVIVVFIESTKGALCGVVFIGVGGLGLFVDWEIGSSNTTLEGGGTARE